MCYADSIPFTEKRSCFLKFHGVHGENLRKTRIHKPVGNPESITELFSINTNTLPPKPLKG